LTDRDLAGAPIESEISERVQCSDSITAVDHHNVGTPSGVYNLRQTDILSVTGNPMTKYCIITNKST